MQLINLQKTKHYIGNITFFNKKNIIFNRIQFLVLKVELSKTTPNNYALYRESINKIDSPEHDFTPAVTLATQDITCCPYLAQVFFTSFFALSDGG